MNIFSGFCMALADSVPGVSGGTIAFILGVYEELLNSINILITKDRTHMKEAVTFLLKLMTGWIAGMVISISVLANLFHKNIYFMSSIFIGLTISSVVYIYFSEYRNLNRGYRNIFYFLAGIAIVILISYSRKKIAAVEYINMDNLKIHEMLYIYAGGIIAISAMVLPGLSGSTLLLILGLYLPIIDSLSQLFRFRFEALPGLLLFAAGIATGLIFSVRIIRRALQKNRNKMIYFILGLTAGSIYTITRGPTTLKNPLAPVDIHNFSATGFIIGIFLIVALELIKKHINGKRAEK